VEEFAMKLHVALLSGILLVPGVASAQVPDAVQDQIKKLEERVRALEAEVQALKSAPAPASAATQSAESTTAAPPAYPPAAQQAPATVPGPGGAQLPVYGGATAMAKILNPDISVIGDFLAGVGRTQVHPVPGLEMHESEIGYQAIVDPYARADFFLSFGEEGVSLEEGYITFTSLPAGFVAKVGKMRSSFGVVNTLHNHVLPWIDRPIVTESLVAGEDGINDAGFSLSRILPAPKGIFLEATGQVFRGDSGDVFRASRRSDASVVGRLRAYRDLTESTNLDLGFSYARGHNDLGSAFLTNLYGVDATLRWKPLRRAIYHSFLWRSEFIWSHREEEVATQRAFGLYTHAEYRLNRRWTVGGRYDRSGRSRSAGLIDNGFSTVLTYWPSEFSQIRGQYRFTRSAEGENGNELRFQFLFALGAHGAHPF
jgi:hypothetical protein